MKKKKLTIRLKLLKQIARVWKKVYYEPYTNLPLKFEIKWFYRRSKKKSKAKYSLGFYRCENKTINIGQRNNFLSQLYILSHELAHAIQHQYYDYPPCEDEFHKQMVNEIFNQISQLIEMALS